ncbi:carboxylesterase/lipase family protein [Nocardia gipuzkoensis]
MPVSVGISQRVRPLRWLVAVVAFVFVVLGCPATGIGGADEGPATSVSGGGIRGARVDGVIEYLGVPFAASTGGVNRFAPPKPAPSWAGELAATAHGPQCPQAPPLPWIPAVQPASEDCLTIDVYVPEHPAASELPIMVWFYGGGFVLGSNAQYDSPARLVRDGQVIVAIPNYRLGPFGFLALPELAAGAGGVTGTYGTLDQQAALRWIRENAAAFGGDSNNITLFGESAGGMSVCTQLASPTARGLYAKAIIESGSCARSPLAPASKDQAYQRSADYATSLGCAEAATRLTCLRALPADQMLRSPTTTLHTMAVTWTPVRDDVVVTTPPENALAEGAVRNIPLVVGSNADEGATFLALLDYARATVPGSTDYVSWAQEIFTSNADLVLQRYPVSAFPTAAEAKQHVITDGFFACPALFTTQAARRGGARVWQYQFNDALLGRNPLLPGAFHGAEVPYIFSGLMGVPIPLPPAADRLSQQMQQSWAQFAHTGNPETPAFTPWPSTSDITLELGSDNITVANSFAHQHHCDLWSGINHIG